MTSRIQFAAAKNGEETCSAGGKFLHSKYNPSAEAEKFAQNLSCDFNPACVIILEPALSYCAPFIRKRFPEAKIMAVRFCDAFSKTDGLWDKVFSAGEGLSDDIFGALGEEKILSALFFEWTASGSAFPEEKTRAWKAVKEAVEKSRDVMATRTYFARRWLKNAITLASTARRTATIARTKSPVLIAASGTSLESSLPHIKERRENFILLACSSAILPLLSAGITPDIAISTDGGFWAKRHLAFPGKSAEFTAALASESAAPGDFIRNREIIPLLYDDSPEFIRNIFESCGIRTMDARRNGTVSGTALEFAASITDGPVFMCGLDQASARGYQHTQPNALEEIASQSDGRLSTKETRTTSARFASEKPLATYRGWFAANSGRFDKKAFRLSDGFAFPNRLGSIRDIGWDEFDSITGRRKAEKIAKTVSETGADEESRRRIALSLLKKAADDDTNGAFTREYFPALSVMLGRETDEAKKKEIERKIAEEKSALVARIAARA